MKRRRQPRPRCLHPIAPSHQPPTRLTKSRCTPRKAGQHVAGAHSARAAQREPHAGRQGQPRGQHRARVADALAYAEASALSGVSTTARCAGQSKLTKQMAASPAVCACLQAGAPLRQLASAPRSSARTGTARSTALLFTSAIRQPQDDKELSKTVRMRNLGVQQSLRRQKHTSAQQAMTPTLLT